jgi:hypothetical protein
MDIWALIPGNQPVTYGPQGRRAEGTGVQLLSLAKLEDYLTVRARLARLNRRIINSVAAIGAANEAAKRAAQLITRLGPVAPSCVALPTPLLA